MVSVYAIWDTAHSHLAVFPLLLPPDGTTTA